MNSRAKGKRGELELAHWLTERGFPAWRGQQHKGGADSPDVVCPHLDAFHIECKRTEAFSLYDAAAQAQRDAGVKTPVVFHRRNDKPWMVVLSAVDFLNIVKPTTLAMALAGPKGLESLTAAIAMGNPELAKHFKAL